MVATNAYWAVLICGRHYNKCDHIIDLKILELVIVTYYYLHFSINQISYTVPLPQQMLPKLYLHNTQAYSPVL
jgi:hypothetical protein